MPGNAYFKSSFLFLLAVERRPEGLGEKWHQLGVLSPPLETFGFCTLEVTPSGCQTPLKAGDGTKQGREVPRQSSSDSSFFPSPSSSLALG